MSEPQPVKGRHGIRKQVIQSQKRKEEEGSAGVASKGEGEAREHGERTASAMELHETANERRREGKRSAEAEAEGRDGGEEKSSPSDQRQSRRLEMPRQAASGQGSFMAFVEPPDAEWEELMGQEQERAGEATAQVGGTEGVTTSQDHEEEELRNRPRPQTAEGLRGMPVREGTGGSHRAPRRPADCLSCGIYEGADQPQVRISAQLQVGTKGANKRQKFRFD